jgi:phosphoglycolate phosphatase
MTLIFDFDGTIANSLNQFVHIYSLLSRKYHLKTITSDQAMEYRHLTVGQFAKILHIPLFIAPFLVMEGLHIQSKIIDQLPIFSGMSEALRKFKHQNIRLGVVSKNSKENINSFLIRENLDMFDFVHSEHSLFGKAKVLTHVINKYHLNSHQTYYVGDEVRDIEACRKTGIPIISVGWGLNSPEILKKYNPDYLVNTPKQLQQVVEKIFNFA